MEAIVLVLVLLALFLGDVRAAQVSLILPLAALFPFLMMREFGLSANLMSLGGLAIASACWWTAPLWWWWKTSPPIYPARAG